MLLQPPVVLVLLATELLYSSVVLAHFLRKIPFSGNLFCFLHTTKLLPDTFPMSITSRVSLDGLRRLHEVLLLEPETPPPPLLNFIFKRDLKPCVMTEDDTDVVSEVPFDGGTQPRLLLLLLLVILLLITGWSSLVLTPIDRHVLGGLG